MGGRRSPIQSRSGFWCSRVYGISNRTIQDTVRRTQRSTSPQIRGILHERRMWIGCRSLSRRETPKSPRNPSRYRKRVGEHMRPHTLAIRAADTLVFWVKTLIETTMYFTTLPVNPLLEMLGRGYSTQLRLEHYLIFPLTGIMQMGWRCWRRCSRTQTGYPRR